MSCHTLTIAPATQARLAQPAAPGQRHAQIVQIAAALIGQGFNTEAVFWQLRPNYSADVPDSEIRSVITWAVSNIEKRDTGHFRGDYRKCSNRPYSPQTPVSDYRTDYRNGCSNPSRNYGVCGSDSRKVQRTATASGGANAPFCGSASASGYRNALMPFPALPLRAVSPIAQPTVNTAQRTATTAQPTAFAQKSAALVAVERSAVCANGSATDTANTLSYGSASANSERESAHSPLAAQPLCAALALALPHSAPQALANTAPCPVNAPHQRAPLAQLCAHTSASERGALCDTQSANYRNTPHFSAATTRACAETDANAQPLHAACARANTPARALAHNCDPVTAIKRYLGGFQCDESDLWERSQIRPAENWETDARTLIATLFRSGENVNIVSRYTVTDGKARPNGYGITQNRETWLAQIARNGPPKSAAGVWMRPNPTDGNGVSDKNVTAYRFLLLEFDTIPLPLQIAFIARLSLPIAAIITSGGKSLHAWIRLNAPNATDYRTLAARIFAALAPFGADTANKNPARLSRLPGVTREIGSVTGTDNRQRLLYLNPEPKAERIIP